MPLKVVNPIDELERLRDDLEQLQKDNVFLQNRYNKAMEDNHFLKEEINQLSADLKQAKEEKDAALRLVYFFVKQELGL